MAKRTQGDSPTLSREEALFQALNSANLAMGDIEGLCQLLFNEQSMFDADFPAPIAAAISMIHERASAAGNAMQEVL
ncbi:TPA: hypothetical protein RNS97_001070 [Stenotrophomonas maltophilia]|nr:hypothetical protein [Stenotrophomonas maltophilia]HDX0845815.1 hypothetical protein [Stenotrophomonas maltophilia]